MFKERDKRTSLVQGKREYFRKVERSTWTPLTRIVINQSRSTNSTTCRLKVDPKRHASPCMQSTCNVYRLSGKILLGGLMWIGKHHFPCDPQHAQEMSLYCLCSRHDSVRPSKARNHQVDFQEPILQRGRCICVHLPSTSHSSYPVKPTRYRRP